MSPENLQELTSLQLRLDSLNVIFETLNIDSVIFKAENLEELQLKVQNDTTKNFLIYLKELQTIYRFYDYYMEQYSELKKELISSRDHVSALQRMTEKKELTNETLTLELLKEKELVKRLEQNLPVKIKDLLNYCAQYNVRYYHVIVNFEDSISIEN